MVINILNLTSKSYKFINLPLSNNIKCRFIGLKGHFLQKLNKSQSLKQYDIEENIKEKLLFNSVIKYEAGGRKRETYNFEDERYRRKSEEPPFLALKYFLENSDIKELEQQRNISNERFNDGTLQVTSADHCEKTPSHFLQCRSVDTTLPCNIVKDLSSKKPKKNWMQDYNNYAEVSIRQEKGADADVEDGISITDSAINYGSADLSIPMSSVPCGGCGACLHCQDPARPGFLPKEIFADLGPDQLLAVVCQRCHFLREYNTALTVNVDPEAYPQLLSNIKDEKALVVLIVDITDFPCSIWPGIFNILGLRRPLVVVGNKVDLLQDWSPNMLERAKEALVAQLPERANVLHTALVSAKTGFGIEQLITSLYKIWQYKGDVYLVGCTNVGKSTLFNALLQSDYCKTRAMDVVQRATTAPWPGTTLNLLKFPITRPNEWKLAVRSARLRQDGMAGGEQVGANPAEATPQSGCNIGHTFKHGLFDRVSDAYHDDPFALPKLPALRRLRAPCSGLDPQDPFLAHSKWFYDTPGVITQDHIINLLTAEELTLTLPQKPLVPRTFSVWAGQSLLIGGVSRLDYISGSANIKMTVLASLKLPVTICFTADTETVYQHYLGTAALAVPCGGTERLHLWPGLQAGQEFSFKGIGWSESCGDVVLSSTGWIAVTANYNDLCRLQAWTPEARGIHVRVPPVLPRAVAVKGRRMYKSQAYALFNEHIKLRKRSQ